MVISLCVLWMKTWKRHSQKPLNSNCLERNYKGINLTFSENKVRLIPQCARMVEPRSIETRGDFFIWIAPPGSRKWVSTFWMPLKKTVVRGSIAWLLARGVCSYPHMRNVPRKTHQGWDWSHTGWVWWDPQRWWGIPLFNPAFVARWYLTLRSNAVPCRNKYICYEEYS